MVRYELRRRAFGWEEPVISGGKIALDAAGQPLMIRRYSGRLLLALGRATLPEVRHQQPPRVVKAR